MRRHSWISVALALAQLFGCSETPPGGAAPVDAGPRIDLGVVTDARLDVASDVGATVADAGLDAPAPDALVRVDTGVDVFAPDVSTDATDATDGGAGAWSPMATPAGFLGRTAHTAVWTGSQMIVFGGENAFAGQARMSTGASYRPSTDSWSAVSSVDARARARHTAVWTGRRMIVWGGRPSDSDSAGEAYDPASDAWTSISSVNAPPARYSGHSAVWTGTEMIVWGGSTLSGTRYDTGGRYDPALDRWTAMSTTGAPSPRGAHVAVWTGTEMIIWGGGSTATLGDGAAYDPARDVWRTLSRTGAPLARLGARASWTGTVMVVWGGGTGADLGGVERRNGGLYDPARDGWVRFETPTSRSAKSNAAVWTGAAMLLWGGSTGSGPEVYLNEGAAFAPASLGLTLLPTLGAPSRRTGPSAVWTGREMLVWGGYEGTTVASTGARYRP